MSGTALEGLPLRFGAQAARRQPGIADTTASERHQHSAHGQACCCVPIRSGRMPRRCVRRSFRSGSFGCRTSGQPRRTPIGGRLVDNRFWLVSNHGEASNYVRNIKADNTIRIRIHGRWRTGTAHLLPGDDPHARLARLPWFNSAMVRALGTDLLTVRIDLD